MTRSLVHLAILTGIPPAAWAAEDEDIVLTAWDLLTAETDDD